MTTMPNTHRVPPTSNTTPPLTETKPFGQAATDDLFLTPRIVDATAYTEYSNAIRTLLTELDARAATLTATSADTDKLCAVLRQAAQQLKTRVDAAAKTERALEIRSASAERAIAAINESIGSEHQLQALVESTIARHRNTLEQRVTESIASLAGKLEAKLANAEQRASRAEQRADAAERRMAQLAERFTAITDQADTIESQVSETLAAAEHNADRSASNALEAIEQLRLVADEVRNAAAGDTAKIETTLGPVRDLLADASSLVGSADKPGTLHRSVAEANTAADRLDTANTENERQLASAAHANAAIIETINAAAESLESLTTRRDELRSTIEEDLETLAAEVSPLERATGTIRRSLDELTERAQSVYNEIAEADRTAQQTAEAVSRAIADSDPTTQAAERIAALQDAAQAITNQTLKQVEEAAEWLAALAAQAHPPQPLSQ